LYLLFYKLFELDNPANSLYSTKTGNKKMSVIIKQVVIETSKAPKMAVGILLGIFIFGIFVVGYDQGQLAQVLFAPVGIHLNHDQLMLIHEFNHDLRHAAGFPCH
jgi:hypothetical protein